MSCPLLDNRSAVNATFKLQLSDQSHASRTQGSYDCGALAVALTVHSSMPMPYQLCTDSICRKVGGTQGVLSTRLNFGVHAHTLHISKENPGIPYDSAHTHTLRCRICL